jgi:serine/threonine protein kinase
MNPSSDKNLLFALIAHHNGYITMEQFFEAAAVWNKEPKRDLGEILVEKKFLDEVERFNIQGIVEDRLRRQGGVDNTLSFMIESGSVPQGDSLPEDWKGKIDAINQAIHDKTPPNPPNFGTPEENPGIHRYIIRKTLGHGGQGYVWEAIDTELNRRVALKNIVPKLSSDPLHQELLIDEARKTGKLRHRGVPPVFDVGKDADGKPFFTMQLISGEKLSESYGNLKYESISRSDFVNQIRPLLRHLTAACYTVEFAFRSEAVIHRDLKPANIMVNSCGETVVMDWGMGKIVTDPSQIKDASSVLFIPMASGSGSQENSVGTIKGTAAFMSPEQARAENDRLDHRTDVYGLGAILYWILTGKPPHKGTFEALPDIQKNLFLPPSQARPSLSIPPELEAICLKAMASQPEDRYQRAGEMAADLENFIAGEPVVALPDNLLRKIERFLRKHARAVIASLLGLTLAVLGLTLANRIIANKNVQLKNSRAVSSSLLEDLVGELADNNLSQIPGANEVRLTLLDRIAADVENYIEQNPDDKELKLDLIRLLTRLAKLEGENGKPDEAIKHWQRADELLKETKDKSDQVFKDNWIKTFCDKSYYHSSELLNQGLVDQADTLIAEACAIAEQYNARVKADRLKTKEFAPAFARLYRQHASIHARRENWAQALDETIKAKGILQPFVEEHLPKLISEPDSTETIKNLGPGELGYYLLLCDEQGDYEAIREKYPEAEKIFLDGLQASMLAPRVELAGRDGTVQKINMLRKLQRLALLTKNFQEADNYYQQAVSLCSQDRLTENLCEKHWFLIECDRARGFAESGIQEARVALGRAGDSLKKIKENPNPDFVSMRENERTITELDFSIVSAQAAISRFSKNEDNLQIQESDKAKYIEKLKNLKAGPYKIRELQLLP